jgi:hypothetical protein
MSLSPVGAHGAGHSRREMLLPISRGTAAQTGSRAAGFIGRVLRSRPGEDAWADTSPRRHPPLRFRLVTTAGVPLEWRLDLDSIGNCGGMLPVCDTCAQRSARRHLCASCTLVKGVNCVTQAVTANPLKGWSSNQSVSALWWDASVQPFNSMQWRGSGRQSAITTSELVMCRWRPPKHAAKQCRRGHCKSCR